MTVIWNSGDATANIVLSGGSLIATASSASSINYQGVRANTSFASGKYYYEWIVGFATSGSYNIGGGWANATANIGGGSASLGADTNSIAIFVYPSTSTVFFNNSAPLGFHSPGANIGDTVSCAFDITGKLVWYRVNGGYWNQSTTADPGTGTGGVSVASIAAGPYYPVFNTSVSAGSITANFGASDFNYSIPSGFSPVDTDVQAYNASAKFLGYNLLSPPQTAVSSSKLLSYAPLAPSQNASVTSKLLGYAILQPLTATPYAQGFVYG